MPEEPKTPNEAIFAIYSRMTSLETTIRGTPNTSERGLVGVVQEVKELAIEVKDVYIEQGKDIAKLQARCRAFHGESGNPTAPGENPLAGIPKKRIIGFLSGAGVFLAMLIYTLGQFFGWWTPPPPD